MFIPDQTKNDLAELLGDEKTLRKLKKTNNTASSSNSGQPSVFGGGIGDFDFGEGCGDGACQSRHERREVQRNAAKAVSSLAKKSEKRSWRQAAVGGVLLIALSGGFSQRSGRLLTTLLVLPYSLSWMLEPKKVS